jgi:hypothetical protein
MAGYGADFLGELDFDTSWRQRVLQPILEIQRKPELGAPASGPLVCHWGCSGVTAWRGTGGLPA